MCGIAGYSALEPISNAAKKQTLDLMKRRGPDHQGYLDFVYSDKFHTCLMHARLSIIDLHERAQQPFKQGSKYITFNGEIYNYIEVREVLKQKGIVFHTDSDVEVLAKAVDYWGYDGLDKLEGMWAFAIYDESDGSITLSRDRFGEKPLYYYEDVDGNIYFASEIKLIANMIGKKLPVDIEHIKKFLIGGYKFLYKGEGQFFKHIQEVKAGAIKIIKPCGSSQEYAYWQPDYAAQEMSVDDAIAQTKEKLIEAVKIRLRSDVPLGFCMSGGVDSNSIIAIAKRLFNYDVEGFTIVNTDQRYEEKSIIDQVVKELDLNHHEVYLEKKNFLQNLKELIKYHDAPVYTITYYVHWLLLRSFKEKNYKIALSGTAADELFSGYYDHHNFYLASVAHNQARHQQAVEEWRQNIGKIVRNPYLQDPDIFIKNPNERRHAMVGYEDFERYFYQANHVYAHDYFYTSRVLRNRMLNEIFHETVPVLLHEDDANAMYHSIENRSPFLDRHLFEFATSIPDEYLIQQGTAKYILRESMRGIVPDVVLDEKKKTGFNAPIEDLIDTHDLATRKELLTDGPIWDILDRTKIEKHLAQKQLSNSMSKFLFSFISVKIFLEEYA